MVIAFLTALTFAFACAIFVGFGTPCGEPATEFLRALKQKNAQGSSSEGPQFRFAAEYAPRLLWGTKREKNLHTCDRHPGIGASSSC